jgi:hypothetical protein
VLAVTSVYLCRPSGKGSCFIQLCALRTTVWTAWPAGRYVSAMPRRNVFDPLEPTHEPRWHVARNMHGAVLESRLLLAATDLKRVFVAPMLEHIDGGWQLGEFGSRGGVFFCARGTERRMISITPTAAGQSGRMAPHIYPTHPGREKGDYSNGIRWRHIILLSSMIITACASTSPLQVGLAPRPGRSQGAR